MKTPKICLVLLLLACNNTAMSEWSQGGPYENVIVPQSKESAQRHVCSNYFDTIKEFQIRASKGDHSQDSLLKLYVESYLKNCQLPTKARSD